jgi:hypothetical protein
MVRVCVGVCGLGRMVGDGCTLSTNCVLCPRIGPVAVAASLEGKGVIARDFQWYPHLMDGQEELEGKQTSSTPTPSPLPMRRWRERDGMDAAGTALTVPVTAVRNAFVLYQLTHFKIVAWMFCLLSPSWVNESA